MPTPAHLYTAHEHLVAKVARSVWRRSPMVALEDLTAAGRLGLWDAALRHGEHPNFEAVARVRIRGAMLDDLRTQAWGSRSDYSAFHFAPVTALAQVSSLPHEPDVIAFKRIAHAIGTLTKREQSIIVQHYFVGLEFQTIAENQRCSAARISVVHKRAIAKLRLILLEEPFH